MRKKKGKKKIDTVEKLAVLMIEGFEQVNRRFEQLNQRLKGLEEEVRRIRNELVDINRRLEFLEEQGARQAGFSKEIDFLIERVAKLEKEVKELKVS